MRFGLLIAALLLAAPLPAAEPDIHPGLKTYIESHGEARLEKVTERVHVARAYDGANFFFVIGDETAALVKLPPHLAAEPTLRDHYHRLSWIVKGLYTRFAGWFGDDALEMIQHTPAAEAERMLALAGGAERVLQRGRAALAEGDAPWAAQLATYLLRAGGGGEPPRRGSRWTRFARRQG